MELFLNDKLGKISIEVDASVNANAILIMAHGAGAGMHHPFMVSISQEMAEYGITSVRFNFPYMEQGRKSPGSPKANIETWKLVVEYITKTHPNLPLFISGKSYGGRMASHLIAEESIQVVKGLIYFGFPLHAPGRDSKDRAAHLEKVTIPQLFLQGTKDKLANIEMMNEVVADLKTAEMKILDDGDHSFNVPKRSGKTKEDVRKYLVQSTVTFINNNLK